MGENTRVVEMMGYHGATTGRWSGKRRTTHTVYPVKHMVVVGTLGTGFDFYGLFDAIVTAERWALDNLTRGSSFRVEEFHDVKGGA